MAYFVFFSNSIATPVPPSLFFSTYVTSLLNMFWALPLELFFMAYSEEMRQTQKKKKDNKKKIK